MPYFQSFGDIIHASDDITVFVPYRSFLGVTWITPAVTVFSIPGQPVRPTLAIPF
jgi:hypothetical protein